VARSVAWMLLAASSLALAAEAAPRISGWLLSSRNPSDHVLAIDHSDPRLKS
jgi:hypothetical protein